MSSRKLESRRRGLLESIETLEEDSLYALTKAKAALGINVEIPNFEGYVASLQEARKRVVFPFYFR